MDWDLVKPGRLPADVLCLLFFCELLSYCLFYGLLLTPNVWDEVNAY